MSETGAPASGAAAGAASFPESLAIRPRGPLDARLRVPGSKSVTNRALLVAALAEGESALEDALESDDTEAMRDALDALGVAVRSEDQRFIVSGTGGRLRGPRRTLDARASGTTARFVTAAATLADGPSLLDGTPRMRERPIDDLVQALSALGARLEIRGRAGCPPVWIAGGGLAGGEAEIDGRRSSQFVSAVLLVAPYAAREVRLRFVEGRVVSRPYVDLTLAVMRDFGADADWTPEGGLRVAAGRRYRGRRYPIEPDASAAAYPFCAAAIAGGRVRVDGIPAASIQADLALLGVLERMGCRVERGPRHVTVSGPKGPLRGVQADMNAMPDAALALAVTALFAEGPTRLTNVANLRLKETDRLAALEKELAKLGARAEASADALTIVPGPLHGAEIDTYEDHRMAMSFALAGLRVPGVVIRDPGCVTKTWPAFFDTLERL
jgi:3-phosphoshikimate 1-carboxyvinyltransferase